MLVILVGLITVPIQEWEGGAERPPVLPPALESARPLLGWWCSSAEQLVARRPKHARFAVTERRHFIGATRVCSDREARYGLTRGFEGAPMFIPVEPVAPPTVVDGSVGTPSLSEGDGWDGDHPPLQERDESERVMQLQFCLVQLGHLWVHKQSAVA